jgi:amino acid adenylation domain-containing protein
VFSAATPSLLADALRDADATALDTLARRQAHCPWQPYRLAVLAESRDEFDRHRAAVLARLEQTALPVGFTSRSTIFCGVRPSEGPAPTVCLFPGFGVRHTTLINDLVAQFPFVERWLDRFGRGQDGTDLTEAPSGRVHTSFSRTLDAVLLGDLAMWTVLCHVGLAADALAGHSFGEHAVLLASGMVTDARALTRLLASVSAITGPLAGRAGDALGLLALSAATRPLLDRWLADDPPRIHVSLDNCPQQVVVWGSADDLAALESQVRERGETTFRLKDLGQPVHTPFLPISDGQLRACYAALQVGPPAIPAWSASTAERFGDDPEVIRDVLAGQWRSTVRFRVLLERLYAEGYRTFVEVGPGDRLTGFVRDTLRSTGAVAVATNIEGRDTSDQLRVALATLIARGHDLNVLPVLGDTPVLRATQRSGTTASTPASETERVIAEEVAMLLDTDGVELNRGFFALGLDSVGCLALVERLARRFARPLPQTAPFDHPSVRQLAHLIDGLHTPVVARARAPQEPVAIVGMSCRLPGGVDTPAAFWDALAEGRSFIRPVPEDRWVVDEVTGDEDLRARISHGAFLEDIRGFDAGFFGISPREASTLDPQHRLLLEGAWHALEHASLSPSALSGTPVGVFVGISGSDYASRFTPAERMAIGGYLATGTMASTAAGRVSFALGFEGPSLAVDTACSSSLVAVHLAAESLRRGECDVALAAGVNVLLNVETSLFLAHGRALSPTGACHTFDASADGYVRGEGCATVVLKRLSDAESAGDRVIAVIRGSAVNHDGRTSALTVPNGSAQERVVREALMGAGLPAEAVTAMEVHGTGTSLGDPIELDALSRVLGPRPAGGRVALGAVKTNVGHLEAAAGVVGLVKMALQLQHRALAPVVGFAQPNPHASWEALSADVVRACLPWTDEVRIGGVSSFGISGTNAHIVLSAPATRTPTMSPARAWLLPMSAASPQAVRTLAARLADALDADPACDIAAVARTLAVGRAHLPWRVAVVVTDLSTATKALRKIADGDGPAIRRIPASPPRVALQFTGQGAQWSGMGRALAAAEPVFSRALDEADTALAPLIGRPIRRDMCDGLISLDDTGIAQPAIFAYGWALAELFAHWGIQGTAYAGHSLGELTAACRAGVATLAQAATMVSVRARQMQALPGGGGMMAVEDTVGDMASLVADVGLDVAAVNGPTSLVVSGPIPALDRLASLLRERGQRSVRLAVSHAFHSALMQPAMAPVAAELSSLRLRTPECPVVSNTTGRVADASITTVDYWVRHLRQPVCYAETASTLADLGSTVGLELGPRAVLTALAPAAPRTGSVQWIAAMANPAAEHESVLEAVGQLYCAGVDPDWLALTDPAPGPTTVLPGYPFEREVCWVGPTRAAGSTAPSPAEIPGIRVGESVRVGREHDMSMRARLLETPDDDRPRLLTRFVQRIVAGILQLPPQRPADPDERLNRLGMDSIMTLQLATTMDREFGATLSPGELLATGTVSTIVHQVLSRLPRNLSQLTLQRHTETEPSPEGDSSQLSYGQQALWFLWRLAPDSVAYHQSLPIRLPATEQESTWRDAAHHLVGRHPMLRTRFVTDYDVPMSVVDPSDTIDWRVIDARDDSTAAVLAREHAVVFDLASAPAVRFRWIQGPEGTVLLITLHHIACDGWSLALIRRDLTALAAALARGERLRTAPSSVSYPDFVSWQRRMLEGEDGERLLAHWRRVLAEPRVRAELPTDRPRPPVQTYAGAAFLLPTSGTLMADLDAMTRRHDVTRFEALLATYAATLATWTHGRDVWIGVPSTGRSQARFAEVVGYFVSPVVMRMQLTGETTAHALIADAARVSRDALVHADYPLPLLVQRLGISADPARSPLFDVTFNYISRQAADAVEASDDVGLEQAHGKFDLTLNVTEEPGHLRVFWGYNADLFDRSTIEALAERFLRMSEQLARDYDGSVLETCPARRPVLKGRRTSVAALVPVHEQVLRQAEARPDAAAVSDGTETMSYVELATQVEAIAHRLQRRGVGPEVSVGLLMDRSVAFVVNMLAVLRAGGAYVPLDPRTASPLRSSLWARAGVDIVIGPDGITGDASGPRWSASDPLEHLAYVIFTSGTTGPPKAVGIEHRALANYVTSIIDDLAIEPGMRHGMVSTVTADLGHTVLFPALATGGTLIVVPEAVATSPVAWSDFMSRHAIDYLKIVPSHLAALLTGDQRSLPRRGLWLGGEACDPHWAQTLRSQARCRVFNHYGPTETTVGVMTGELPDHTDAATMPLLRSVANVDIWLLDEHGLPVGHGDWGEVVVSGAAVARGYIGEEARSADRFPELPGIGRVYRTGDRACVKDGQLLLMGRTDRQIKVRGFRVDPAQVESVLRRHPSVRQAVVLPDAEGPSAGTLLAWVLPTDSAQSDDLAATMRNWMAEQLPVQMQPSRIEVVGQIPLTTNGKVDAAALRARVAQASAVTGSPRTLVELRLLDIWSGILESTSVGLDDDFFECGGHSLAAVRLAGRIEAEFGIRLPLATFFLDRTVRRQAQRVSATSGSAMPALIPLRSTGHGVPLILIPGAGGSLLYFDRLIQRISRTHPIWGARAIGLGDGAQVPASVADLAGLIASAIREAGIDGPVAIAGHSFGALVGVDVAARLPEYGRSCTALFLLDQEAPAREAVSETAIANRDWLTHIAVRLERLYGLDLTGQGPIADDTALVSALQRASVLSDSVGREAMAEYVALYRANALAAAAYRPDGAITVPVSVIRAEDHDPALGRSVSPEPDLGWRAWTTGPVSTATVPGTHISMLQEPAVGILGRLMSDLLARKGIL